MRGKAGEVELARVDHHAADAVAVAAEEFRGGMGHDRGAPVDRPAEVGRGEGAVDDEGDVPAVGQLGQGFQVEDRAAGVADDLAEQGAGLGRDGGLPGLQIARIDEADRDRQLLQRVGELGHRSAVEMGRGDDLVAGLQQRHEDGELGRHAAGHGHGAGAVLQRGHALLEDGRRRVADPRVDVAVLLQVEELGRLLRIVEDVGGRLVDGHRAGPDVRIGDVPGMQHAGFKTELSLVFGTWWQCSSGPFMVCSLWILRKQASQYLTWLRSTQVFVVIWFGERRFRAFPTADAAVASLLGCRGFSPIFRPTAEPFGD